VHLLINCTLTSISNIGSRLLSQIRTQPDQHYLFCQIVFYLPIIFLLHKLYIFHRYYFLQRLHSSTLSGGHITYIFNYGAYSANPTRSLSRLRLARNAHQRLPSITQPHSLLLTNLLSAKENLLSVNYNLLTSVTSCSFGEPTAGSISTLFISGTNYSLLNTHSSHSKGVTKWTNWKGQCDPLRGYLAPGTLPDHSSAIQDIQYERYTVIILYLLFI
jgi:hypothetical protein